MPILLPRPFIAALLIWALLVGCESNKAPATAETPVSIAKPKPAPDAIDAIPAPATDTAVEVAQVLPSGDIPAFHKAFETRKTIAPGLVIVEKSIQQPVTAIIRDPWDIKETFSIVRNGWVIYRDTANGMTYDFSEQPEIRKRYPMWIPTGGNNGELLVAFDNRPSIELARRYFIQNNQIVRIDTLPVFIAAAKNLDKDSLLELSGVMSYSEVWDDEHGKRYISYDPRLYYEIRPSGLVLDSALTRKKVKAEYGVFRGFKFAEHLKVLVSQLPKESPKRP